MPTRRGTLQRDADAIDATSASRWPCLVDAVDVVPRRYLNTGFRVEATGRDAELLRILRERWGDGLVFEHTDSSEPGHISGHFRAPNFMDRGVSLKFLSAFPGEAEYLYPPMTYLRPTESQVIPLGGDTKVTVIEMKAYIP